MADSPASVAAESPAQEKARLRRERRAAKIQSGGASRLQAITALQGGSHRDVEKDVPAKLTPSASPQPKPANDGTETPDPEEIDISDHHYAPASQPRLPSPFAYDPNSVPPFAPAQGTAGSSQESMMMDMLQQMMGQGAGGMPGAPGQAGGPPGDLPPGLANLFSSMQGGSAQEPSPEQSSAWVWRLVHSLFALGLAVYIVLQSPFTGSKVQREANSHSNDDWAADDIASAQTFGHFFYLFATFEVVLQSSRYFIERGQLQGNGFLSSIAQLLPEPYAGYIRVVGRYSVIYSTVVSDAMVVVFVLGATTWWQGAAVA